MVETSLSLSIMTPSLVLPLSCVDSSHLDPLPFPSHPPSSSPHSHTAAATAALAHAQAEKALLAASEKRLTDECARLTQQHERQEKLVQQLHAMQVCVCGARVCDWLLLFVSNNI